MMRNKCHYCLQVTPAQPKLNSQLTPYAYACLIRIPSSSQGPADAPSTHSASATHQPEAEAAFDHIKTLQVDLFLSATGMPCDLSSPRTARVSAVVEKLQSSYLAQ